MLARAFYNKIVHRKKRYGHAAGDFTRARWRRAVAVAFLEACAHSTRLLPVCRLTDHRRDWSKSHERNSVHGPTRENILTRIVALQIPCDRRALEVHFAALGSEDLRYRFCGSIKPDGITHYVDQLNRPDVSSFGIYFAADITLIAVCQLGQSGGELEVGVSVLPAFRRKGLAKALLEYSARHARERGLRTLLIHTLMDNTPMLTLARRMGMRIEMLDGEADGRLRLRADTIAEASSARKSEYPPSPALAPPRPLTPVL